MVGIRGRASRRAALLKNVRTRAHKSKPTKVLAKKRSIAAANTLAQDHFVESRETVERSYKAMGLMSKPNKQLDWKPVEGEETVEVPIDVPEAAEPIGLKYHSSGECAWLSEIIAVHGDNYRKMFYDLKLNPYQLTEGQIRKKVVAYQKVRQAVEAVDDEEDN